MQKKKLEKFKIVMFYFFSITFLTIQHVNGQCKEFQISDYEIMCKQDFVTLKKFLSGKGYTISAMNANEPISKSTVVQCGSKILMIVSVGKRVEFKATAAYVSDLTSKITLNGYRFLGRDGEMGSDEEIKYYDNSNYGVVIEKDKDMSRWNVTFMPSTNKIASNKQCTELTIAELEKICTLDYEKLEAFLLKKGFTIRDTDEKYTDALIDCNGNKSFLVTLNETVGFFEKDNKFTSKFIQQLKANGYKFFQSKDRITIYRSSIGAAIIETDAKEGNYIRIQPFKKSNAENLESKSEKVPAKKITPTKLEVDSYTNTTEIKLKKGEDVSITATGSITYGAWAGSGGPNGIDGYISYNRIQGFRHGCLLARIGDNGEWKAVGESYTIRAADDGVLQFIVNDGDPSNNSGHFVVDLIIITKDGELKKVNR